MAAKLTHSIPSAAAAAPGGQGRPGAPAGPAGSGVPALPAPPRFWDLAKANLKMSKGFLLTVPVIVVGNFAINVAVRLIAGYKPTSPELLTFGMMTVAWGFVLVMGVLEYAVPSVASTSGASRLRQIAASWTADLALMAVVVPLVFILPAVARMLFPGASRAGYELYSAEPVWHGLAMVFAIVALAAAGRLIGIGFVRLHWTAGVALIVPWLALAAVVVLFFVPMYGQASVGDFLQLPRWGAPLVGAVLVAASVAWGRKIRLTTL